MQDRFFPRCSLSAVLWPLWPLVVQEAMLIRSMAFLPSLSGALSVAASFALALRVPSPTMYIPLCGRGPTGQLAYCLGCIIQLPIDGFRAISCRGPVSDAVLSLAGREPVKITNFLPTYFSRPESERLSCRRPLHRRSLACYRCRNPFRSTHRSMGSLGWFCVSLRLSYSFFRISSQSSSFFSSPLLDCVLGEDDLP